LLGHQAGEPKADADEHEGGSEEPQARGGAAVIELRNGGLLLERRFGEADNGETRRRGGRVGERAFVLGEVEGLVFRDYFVQQLDGGAEGFGQLAAVVASAEMMLDVLIVFVAGGKWPARQHIEDLVAGEEQLFHFS
jgi:hypothetical protein